VVKFLEAAGFDEIWTFDFHEIAATGIFSVPFSNIFAFDILAKHVKHFLGSTSHLKNTVIVAPDQEGIERARIFGKSFYGTESFETATVSKQRNLDSLHQSKALELFGDVKDKTAILVDDICTSGGTLIHAAEKCLEKGAKRIFAVITHPDFIDGVQEKIQASPFEKFFTTNTIPFKKNAKFDKLIEVSIAETIASKLKHV
jgi:ribose-phosphate pyrophosphokinase